MYYDVHHTAEVKEECFLKSVLQKDKRFVLAVILIVLGALVRIFEFCTVPSGLNQDEAFAGYEAFSLLNYGIDSAGYHNPCYFVSWGSGMNVLESYLAIPFIKIFGCSVFAIRMPQLLCSIASLFVFWLLLRKIFTDKIALLGLFILAISPWHIMLSKWGLESNLAPAFLLFGFFFLIKGLNNNKFWIFSAIFYGLALYAYSITWVVIPLTLILFAAYMIFIKQKFSIKYTLISVAVLFVFAVPLLLFLMVNKGLIPEIKTSFISIPKLLSMRDSEIALKNLISLNTYKNFFNVVINQNDSMIWNTIPDFGLYYKISIPFMILGIIRVTSNTVKSIRKREFSYYAVVALGAVSSVIVCLLIAQLNTNKANSLHIFSIAFIAVGINEIFDICKNHKIIKQGIICLFALNFITFGLYYFTDYNETVSYEFRNGVEESVEFVKSKGLTDVCVDTSIYYPQILFFDNTPTDEFLKTVKYSNYPSAFLNTESFTEFSFGIDYNNLRSHSAYIFPTDKQDSFSKSGYEIVNFDEYSVAY